METVVFWGVFIICHFSQFFNLFALDYDIYDYNYFIFLDIVKDIQPRVIRKCINHINFNHIMLC